MKHEIFNTHMQVFSAVLKVAVVILYHIGEKNEATILGVISNIIMMSNIIYAG